jgi:hypothetical protein
VLEDGFEGASLDELHGQEGPAIGKGSNLMYGRDAGVLQLAGDPTLARESLGGRRASRITTKYRDCSMLPPL